MLRQRVITAVVLLVLLGAVLGSGSAIAFVLTLAVFFGAACWEALKLSGMRFALPLALMSAALLLPIISRATSEWIPLASVCTVLWLLRFFPALRFGLPPNAGLRGALFNSLWGEALHTIPVVPRLKLIDPVEDRFADFYERRPDLHCTPVPKGADRNAATIAFGHLFRREECGL